MHSVKNIIKYKCAFYSGGLGYENARTRTDLMYKDNRTLKFYRSIFSCSVNIINDK